MDTTTVLIDPKSTLADLTDGLTASQRHYISLRLAGLSPSDARNVISRRPETVDRWLVEPNFRLLDDYLSTNKERFRDQAMTLWASALSSKAKLLLELLIEAGLDELVKKENKDLGMLRMAANAATALQRQTAIPLPDQGSYDELILKRHLSRST